MKKFGALKGSYTKLPNELLNDQTLSWKAKGLFCFMASKKDSYNFTMRSIAKQFIDGKAAIYSAMDELKDRGWVSYYRNLDGTGKYILYTTLETTLTPDPDNQDEPKPDPDNQDEPHPDNQDEPVSNPDNQDEPNPDNRDPDNPTFRKSGRNNKTDLHNKKDIYKGEDKKTKVLLPPADGDVFGSSTKYSQNQIIEMMLQGVIDVH